MASDNSAPHAPSVHKHYSADGARFQRRMRLVAKADYSRVFQNPKKSIDRLFTVLVRRNECEEVRLGLAISRKNVRSAVQRNRVKRIVRESFREHRQQLLNSDVGIDIVVIGRAYLAQALLAKDNAGVFSSLQNHWQRLAKTMTA